MEFALIVPILISLLLGIMEFGWLSKNNLLVANATREGARAAALGKTTGDIQTRIQNAIAPLNVTSPNGSISMLCSTDNGTTFPYGLGNNSSATQNDAPSGSLIKVTVTTQHKALTGFFPFLKNRTIQVFVIMRREPA